MSQQDEPSMTRDTAATMLGLRSRLATWEMAFVRQHVAAARTPGVKTIALVLNHLGNGWLYPLLAGLLWWAHPEVFGAIAAPGGAAAIASHAVYPWIKRAVARDRPCQKDPALPSLLRVLDRYSFPSGHCMTITAVAIPVCAALPQLTAPAALACALVAWARVAAAHHYPTDIVAGIALGAVVSVPITLLWG